MPKSDLPTRMAAALVMIAAAAAAIYVGGWPFRIFVGVAAALMLAEYCGMLKMRQAWRFAGMILLAINLWIIPAILPSSATLASGEYGMQAGFGAILLAAAILGLAARCPRLASGYAYVAIPSFALLMLIQISWQMVFWAMIVTWSTDIFAYFAGRSIGGPKLAPSISPNKTWAGLIGGMAGAGMMGAATAAVFQLDMLFSYAGAAMGLLAQMGDLYESALKRKAGVKDSGKIIPGHGGVLDRVDGLLPVVVATLALAAVSA